MPAGDGSFEYGTIQAYGAPFVVHPMKSKDTFLAYGVFCRDNTCMAGEVDFKNLIATTDPKPPHLNMILESTFKFAGKEIYMKGDMGVMFFEMKGFTGPITLAGEAGMAGLNYGQVLTRWREKDSPKFNLQFSGIEFMNFSTEDLEDFVKVTGGTMVK